VLLFNHSVLLVCAVLDAFAGHTDRIAKGVLVYRLVTKDEEASSGWMMTSIVKWRYKALFHEPCACANRLQLFEEQPRSLQVRRLKPFREPAIYVLEPVSRVV